MPYHWLVIEQLPRIRLGEEARILGRYFTQSFHHDDARDGFVVPRKIEFRRAGWKRRVVQIRTAETQFAIVFPNHWPTKGYGRGILRPLSGDNPIPWWLFQPMLYGDVAPALHVFVPQSACVYDEREPAVTSSAGFSALVHLPTCLLRGHRFPVSHKSSYAKLPRRDAWIEGTISGWEAYLLCDRCLDQGTKRIEPSKVAPWTK